MWPWTLAWPRPPILSSCLDRGRKGRPVWLEAWVGCLSQAQELGTGSVSSSSHSTLIECLLCTGLVIVG